MLLFLFTNICNAYTKNDMNIQYYWYNEPQIVLCNDSHVLENNIITAINFWKNLGFKLKKDIVKKSCEKEFVSNEIRITGQRDLDVKRYYGMTYRNYNQIGENFYLDAATIKIDNNFTQDLNLIIHEIGHSLGVDHEEYDKSHIMHHLVVEAKTTRHF